MRRDPPFSPAARKFPRVQPAGVSPHPVIASRACGIWVARSPDVAENPTSMNSKRRRIEDLVMRIEGEFLDALVDAEVLFKTRDRVYGRLFPYLVAA
jgi:hypothetical protein